MKLTGDARRLNLPNPNESGLCQCGCRQPAPIATYTHRPRGWVAGYPKQYISGHNGALSGQHYIIEDRGYATPCHIWQRSKTQSGHGHMKHNGKMRLAHVVYYEEKYSPVPEGLQLDHLCRQRDCVNADHLEPVTGAENCRRGARTILTKDSVVTIKALLAIRPKIPKTQIARRFGVDPATIWDIEGGRTWKDV